MTLELKENKVLKFNPNTLQDVRKNHGFDYPGICQAIDILEQWIAKQEHFVRKDFNRDYLERVIIHSKGSIEASKKRIDKMCMMRTVLPEFYDKWHPANDFPDLKKHIISVPMPKLTEDNCRIHIVQLRNNDLTTAVLMDSYKFVVIMNEYIKLKDYSDGVHGVLDMRNVKMLNYLKQFNAIEYRDFVSLYMHGYGFRVKGLYILSSSKHVSSFINLIRPFFGAKVGQRLHALPDLDSLHKCLPKHLLSEDYGGKQESMNQLFDYWVEELSSEENVKYMKETRQFCTNEKMRPSDKFNEEYHGMPGTFKLLNVD